MRYAPLLLAVFFATPVSAAVLISEIAWMGSTENTAHEWIELHNTSEQTVIINQWKIESQDGTPTIALQGEISAGAYLIIKRSAQTLPVHDGYIPSSFGALGNTGEVLFLKNASGEIIDTVEGIPWPAGDNTTKETMQRNGSQWVTASATPGNPTVITTSAPAPSVATTSAGSVTTTSPQKTVAPTMRIVGPRDASVFTPYQFSIVVTGTTGEETVVHGVEVFLGDGTQRTTSSTTQVQEHIYEFPGTYVLSARYHLWGRDPLTARHILTVREPRLSYTVRTGNREAVILKNESPHELSLHRFSLHNAHRFYTFPFGATILPNGEMIITNSILRFNLDEPIMLVYPNGEVYLPTIESEVTEESVSIEKSIPATIVPAISQRKTVTDALPPSEVTSEVVTSIESIAEEIPPQEEKRRIPAFVFLTVGGVLVFSLFQRLLHQPASSDEEA